MDPATSVSEADGSKFNSWCDTHFSRMYSHGDFSQPSNPKISPTNKTLYTSSQERILANTKHPSHSVGNGDHRGLKLESQQDCSPHSHDSFSPQQKTGSSKLKSIATLVQGDQSKHTYFQYDDETSHSNPDSGVSKRCFGDDFQEPELTERKLKKKKYKKHSVSPSARSSVTMKSVFSVVSNTQTNMAESTNEAHRFQILKHGKDREFQSEKVDNGRQIGGKTKESSPAYRKKSPAKSSRGRQEDPSQMMIGSPKKTCDKAKSKEKSYAVNADMTEMDKNQNRPPLIKDKNGFLLLLNSSPPPNQPRIAEDNERSESTQEKRGHQRTDSASSISSTSTSASSASVASAESLSCTESKIYTKTTKTTKTVVSYKTAKHVHKSKRSKDNYDNSEKSSKKHGSRPKEDVNGEKARSRQKKPVRQHNRPDAALVLSHIKKAFASSCTDSESEASPLKNASIMPKIAKSIAMNVKECSKALAEIEKHQAILVKKSESDVNVKSSQYSPKEPKKFGVLNTTYKFSENKPKQPVSLACNFSNTTYKLSETNLKQRTSPVYNSNNSNETNVKETSVFTQAKLAFSPNQLAPASLFERTKKNDLSRAQSSGASYSKEGGNTKEPANKDGDEKMPALEEYDVEPDELGSDSDGDSWKQMVEQITEEKKDTKWDYVVDSQRRRLRVEGTTYAAPHIHWQTNWYGPRAGSTLVRPPLPRAPPPHPPPLSYPPPRAPTYNLYQKASQRMFNPSATSPYLQQNASPQPSRRQEASQEDSSLTTKKHGELEEGELDELDGEIYYSSDEDGNNYDVSAPLFSSRSQHTSYSVQQSQTSYSGQQQSQTSYSGQQSQTSYSGQQSQAGYSGQRSQTSWGQQSNVRNLPPRLMKLQQQYSRNSSYNSPAQSSSWNQSYHPQGEQDTDTSNVVNTWDNYNSGFSTPRSSWPVKKSFSPGTPFEYDTSSIVYPYTMKDYIDTHCHIDFLYQRLGYKGTFGKFSTENHFPPNYAGCVAIFCTPESMYPHSIWKDLLEEEKVWGAFGVHPHHIKHYDGRVEENIYNCMKHPKAVAVGEIGLDYSNRNSSDWILQQEVFRRQLDIALKLDKPLVIHSRDAEDDTIDIMASMVPRDYPIHRHCFTGTPEEARRWFSVFPKSFIGLTALVTFASAIGTHRTAEEIPLERLLLETDAPYFLPKQVPRNLKYANPSMAVFVAERIARLKGITTDEVLTAVRKNTTMMYDI